MKVKKGTKIRIIADLSSPEQNLIDMSKYIRREFQILDHWQNWKNALDDGEVLIEILEEGGTVVLNKGEYKVVVE